MRYIDADLLQEDFKADHGGKRSLMIDTQPTADVRENVRGEWIQDEIAEALGVYLCSNCNIPTQIVDGDGNTKLTRFCPNCGADMRREDNGRDEENHNRV